jgi:hypothetical protein
MYKILRTFLLLAFLLSLLLSLFVMSVMHELHPDEFYEFDELTLDYFYIAKTILYFIMIFGPIVLIFLSILYALIHLIHGKVK